MSKNSNTIKTDNKESKTWNFAKDGVTLNFTLRTDIKGEMTPFLLLLKQAAEDLEKEINSRFP